MYGLILPKWYHREINDNARMWKNTNTENLTVSLALRITKSLILRATNDAHATKRQNECARTPSILTKCNWQSIPQKRFPCW